MASNFIQGIKADAFIEHNTQKNKELDAYEQYISENLAGFLELLETFNEVLNDLEKKSLTGKIELKARIKAAGSCLTNTSKKALDDIFGFEIITQNERDKEIAMLILHNIFDEKHTIFKNHNKSNGYKAHHCTGVLNHEFDLSKIEDLKNYIVNAKTYQIKDKYKDLPKKEQQKIDKAELLETIPRYPTLLKELQEKGEVPEDAYEAFSTALIFMDRQFEIKEKEHIQLRKQTPIIEIQFKTENVAKEATSGTAKHISYKPVNEQEIIQRYNQKKLIRGIDFPFKFYRNNEGKIELESTNRTLINMWPFLEETIKVYKTNHKESLLSYDMYLAQVFPDLKTYIERLSKKEPCLKTKNEDKQHIWHLLKTKILNDSFVLKTEQENSKVV